ncbi:alpha/beta hydrolase [Microlunatus ginsengisoli]|uniref:Enterochelin esterase n=1 Tax=Microlunatus ginsengisoli TaxID=363863 RepID=A0ABP6ZM67_9ACTN
MPAPDVRDEGVTWHIPVDLAPGGVRLEVDWVLAGDPEFSRADAEWTYALRRPAARRLEYRLLLRDADGHGDPGPDPTNPRRIGNPFGDRSVIDFADYRPPEWVGTEPAGELVELDIRSGRLGRPIPTRLWSPSGLDPAAPAPLLVANDGTGLANDAQLLGWATWHGGRGRPLRVLLLDPAPGCRDDWYAANDDYADDVAELVLPAAGERVAVAATAGLGISLGALAMLTLQRRRPDRLDALALQSGSFFTPRTDPQESGYGHFEQVCAAVRRITLDPAPRTVPAFVCCGAIEENLANNLELADALDRQGYPVDWTIFPDAHTMIGWRDAWTPGLDRLIDALDRP